jgi:Transposase DDE domain
LRDQTPVAPPAYQRAQDRRGPALHINALTLVTNFHLLTLCGLAVRLAHRRCPPPLPAGPGGAPRIYSEESLLLIGLLRTLWRLSYQDRHDWLMSWPALALACGLPLDKDGHVRVPSKSQQCKRRHSAGAPVHESLFVLTVQQAIRLRLIGARDLIIDSAPILAWRRQDPDAAYGHAPAHHPRPLLRGFRVHTLLCRGSGLPLFFLLSPANSHDAPFAQRLLAGAVRLYQIRPRLVRLDAAYWGIGVSLLGFMLHSVPLLSFRGILKTRKTAPAYLQPGPEKNLENGAASNASDGTRFSLFPSPTSSLVWVV